MLRDLIVGAIRRFSKKGAVDGRQLIEFLEKAHEMWAVGDVRAALQVYKAASELFPNSVEVLNGLGACHATLGDSSEAAIWFERAFLLDDSYLPSLINRARAFGDRRNSAEALPLLRHALAHVPGGAVDALLYSVYASMALNNGDVSRGTFFQTKAWLADFDTLRMANGHLFYSSYADASEQVLASEHVFWAETMRPLDNVIEGSSLRRERSSDEKIRIGYWSPDLRNHSVRYFFRPLIDNHDRERFDIYVYQDNHAKDAQTELICASADHYHDVHDFSDQALYDLIRSHELDVLVELAGHTSANRLSLLTKRMAKMQVTALGYPPTTGMTEIDCKIVDKYSVGKEPQKYYSEYPLELSGSFWCFDPMEDYAVSPVAPARKNGYVTFGCFGNVAKISDRLLACWGQILDGVPMSRLVIRSISFEDGVAIDHVRNRLQAAGFDIDRVELLKPLGGADLFNSYADVDVILDTFPFNGGTTTCFATYMGAPVVSLYGESLISRMGLSILSNLGWPELAVATESEYVNVAIKLAGDLNVLERYRTTARERYKSTTLGNGKLYAADFESACVEFLKKLEASGHSYAHHVPPIPILDAVKRAYKILATGNVGAAGRVLAYCKKYYPSSGAVKMLEANLQHAEDGSKAAIQTLERSLDTFVGDDRVAGTIMVVHWLLAEGDLVKAKKYVAALSQEAISDPFDRIQVELFKTLLAEHQPVAAETRGNASVDPKRVIVIVPSDAALQFEGVKSSILKRCELPQGWKIEFQRCDIRQRISSYERVMQSGADYVIVMQGNVDICSADFFYQVANSLEQSDVVGFAGARRWEYLDWRLDDFDQKAGGFMVLTDRSDFTAEVRYWGGGQERMVFGMDVLDGSVFAVNVPTIQLVSFDEELADADFLMEEDWICRVGNKGARLAVNRAFGVVLHKQAAVEASKAGAGRLHWMEQSQKDPFMPYQPSDMVASVLVLDPLIGCEVLTRMVSKN